jgi:acyl-coenzyme A thioesterase PaaI-like protein
LRLLFNASTALPIGSRPEVCTTIFSSAGDNLMTGDASDTTSDWPSEIVSLMVAHAPYSAALGMRYVSSSPYRGSIILPWRADLAGIDGTDILAPGAVTALIDHTCGLAIMAGLGMMAAPATLDLRIDHMRPAAPRTDVTCAAHCYKATRNIAFLRAEAWDVSPNDPIATAQAAFTLNRRVS